MVISQSPGNNPSYYYRITNAASIVWMLPETPYTYTCNYNIRVTHRNGAIKHIFTRIRSTEGSSVIVLFILSLHALALHLAVKILLQIFLCLKIWSTLFYIHLSVAFSRMPAGPHSLLRNQYYYENIPNIWHKSSTKHKDMPDQIETIKTINAKLTRPRITWKVLPMAQVAIFKEIFDQVRKDLDCELFYSETSKRVTTSHIIFTI